MKAKVIIFLLAMKNGMYGTFIPTIFKQFLGKIKHSKTREVYFVLGHFGNCNNSLAGEIPDLKSRSVTFLLDFFSFVICFYRINIKLLTFRCNL